MTSSTVAPADRARAVIDEILAENRKLWKVRYLARRADVTVAQAQDAIDAALRAGVLARFHELMCPVAGDTLACFADGDALPEEGKLVECHACNMNQNEWHEIYSDMFDVRYAAAGHVLARQHVNIAD